MKKMKRILTMGMAGLTMLTCAFGMTSCNEETGRKMQMIAWGTCMGEFAYLKAFFHNGLVFLKNTDGEGYTVATLGLYKDKRVEISSEYWGEPVTTLSSGYWMDYDMETLVIPSSVKALDNWSLPDCDELTNIVVDERNAYFKSVDGNVYSKDGTLFVQYAGGKEAENFRVPDGVLKLDYGAFAGCNNVKTVELPVGLTHIGDQAFFDCEALTSVQLPEGLVSIGMDAFKSCDQLKEVHFPNTLQEIGRWSFTDCNALERVEVPASVQAILGRAFSSCDKLKEVEIAEGVTEIGAFAFAECESLTDIVIPKSVTTLETSVFLHSTGLKNVYYHGTMEDWAKVTAEYTGEELLSATKYYYSETEPIEEGNYWHYVDGEVVVW